MVAHLSHYQKTTFESFARNHIAGSSKGRTLDSLPSNLGSTPSRAPKVVHAYVNCEPRERMDCSPLRQLPSASMVMICGFVI